MFWLSSILTLIFLTPVGWIGMICFGAAVCLIVDAVEENSGKWDFSHGATNERIAIQHAINSGKITSMKSLKEFLDERNE